jgi:hypothetical protein
MDNKALILIDNALGFTRIELCINVSVKDSNFMIFVYNFNYLAVKQSISCSVLRYFSLDNLLIKHCTMSW